MVNNGHVPQYYLEGCHEAIIPRGLYMQVQEELVRLVNLKTGKAAGRSGFIVPNMHFQASCFVVSVEIFILGFIGTTGARKSVIWRCVSRLEEKGSGSPTILKEDFQGAVVKAINQVIAGSTGFIEVLEHNIATVLGVTFDKDTSKMKANLLNYKSRL